MNRFLGVLKKERAGNESIPRLQFHLLLEEWLHVIGESVKGIAKRIGRWMILFQFGLYDKGGTMDYVFCS